MNGVLSWVRNVVFVFVVWSVSHPPVLSEICIMRFASDATQALCVVNVKNRHGALMLTHVRQGIRTRTQCNGTRTRKDR